MAAAHYYQDSYPYAQEAYHRGPPTYPEATYPPPPRESGGRPQDDTDDSYVEEIRRDFPPGSYAGGYNRSSRGYPPAPAVYDRNGRHRMGDGDYRRSKSTGGRRRHGDYGYTRDDDHRRGRGHASRRHRRPSYSESSLSRSPSPKPRRRRKSVGDQAKGALGEAAAALGLSQSRSRNRDRYDDRREDRGRDSARHRQGRNSSSRSDSESQHPSFSRKELTRGLTAALTAGAAEAYRTRNKPGTWQGEKGKRVLTAALGAGGTEGVLDQHSDDHGKRHFVESALAGLATNHLVNGPRSESARRSGSRRQGRRARSEHRGGVKDLASGGLLAAAGKEAYNYYNRSKSRGGRRRSDDSSDDEGGRSRRPGASRKRSHSVSAYLNKGLAALGLDDDQAGDRKGNRRQRRTSSSSPEDSDGGGDDHYYSKGNRSAGGRQRRSRRDRSRDRHGGNYRDVSRPRSLRNAVIPMSSSRRPVTTADSDSGSNSSDSDTGSSTDDERTRKKLHRRRLMTAGFASVATINAAHELSQTAQKHTARRKQLKEGEISPEEARKLKWRGNMKDAASLALMGIGVKGVADEWSEAAKHHNEWSSFKSECEKRDQERGKVRGGSRKNLLR